jgi:hypothetical protein
MKEFKGVIAVKSLTNGLAAVLFSNGQLKIVDVTTNQFVFEGKVRDIDLINGQFESLTLHSTKE